MAGLVRWLGVAALLSYGAGVHAANGTIGTGTPASCTDTAFNNVLFNVSVTGGGTITFNCGSAPHIILITSVKNISVSTILEGGGGITLSGGNATSLFQVLASGALTLNNIVLTRAFGVHGAIENFGTLTINGGRIENNSARASGGAVINHGTVQITDVTLADNAAVDWGGAVHNDTGLVFIKGSRLLNNSAGQGGGAVNSEGPVATQTAMSIETSLLQGNQSLAGRGGAVRVAGGDLEISDSTLRFNDADSGGALHVLEGDVELIRLQIIANHAHSFGAGVRQEGGTIVAQDLFFIYNGSPDWGLPGAVRGLAGGAFSIGAGSAKVLRATMIENEAASGGAVHQLIKTSPSPATTFTNMTISGNKADDGGAIYLRSGTMTLVHATIADNQAAQGAGINKSGSGVFTLHNSALANPLGKNCTSAITLGSFNLSSDASCSLGAGHDNAALAFDAFANNGGYTFTRAPVAGSPAIDGAGGTQCTSTDQRGAARPAGLACDIGAVEYLPGSTPIASAVEFFHRDFGHYFVSYTLVEVFKLDLGLFDGWLRTGERFNVFALPAETPKSAARAAADTTPVCRFFTTAFPPKSSHFYAPHGLGCEGTMKDPNWGYEGDVFAMHLPDGSGKCPSGEVPVYRLYNNGKGGAPNHRYTTSGTVRLQMLAAGYIAEGTGIGVGMCSPE